jgi:putative transposase
MQTGGTKDHIHLLCTLSKNHAACKIIEQVKKNSSKWIKTQGSEFAEFQWQNGYGIFSVSQSNVVQTKEYIANQEKHHQKMTFQEEFRRFLEKYRVSFDERYIWD